MTTIANTALALTEPSFVGGPLGSSQAAEQNGHVTNGNKFANAPGKYLLARNTTAGAVGVDFYVDKNGAETKVIDGSVAANKVPANGVKLFGPFPSGDFSDHTTTAAAQNGQVCFLQQSGIAGDLKFSPLQADRI